MESVVIAEKKLRMGCAAPDTGVWNNSVELDCIRFSMALKVTKGV